MTITTDTITLQAGDSAMNVYIALPDTGRAPALIVLQEAFGVNSYMKDIARRFAEQGYVAIAPELFHRTAPAGFTASYTDFASLAEHMKAVTLDTLEQDVQACYDWLLKDHQPNNERIGSIGFCMGGRASFVANAKLPLQAAVSFYGGGIVPNLLPLAESIHGPMLLVWGGLDKHIDADYRRAVSDALTGAGKNFVSVEFSDADHGFFCDERPAYNPNAGRQAWALTLSFLATYLKS